MGGPRLSRPYRPSAGGPRLSRPYPFPVATSATLPCDVPAGVPVATSATLPCAFYREAVVSSASGGPRLSRPRPFMFSHAIQEHSPALDTATRPHGRPTPFGRGCCARIPISAHSFRPCAVACPSNRAETMEAGARGARSGGPRLSRPHRPSAGGPRLSRPHRPSAGGPRLSRPHRLSAGGPRLSRPHPRRSRSRQARPSRATCPPGSRSRQARPSRATCPPGSRSRQARPSRVPFPRAIRSGTNVKLAPSTASFTDGNPTADMSRARRRNECGQA